MAVKKMKLDFSKVEERSGYNTKGMPLGLHAFKVVDVHDQEAGDGTAMWVFDLVPTTAAHAAKRFPYYCKLQQNQLWKLRDLFVAAGVKVPKSTVTLDPNKVVGKIVAGEVIEGTGNFSDRTEINGIYGVDTLGDDAGEEPEAEDDEDETDEYDDADEADDDTDEEDSDDEDEVDEDELREELEALSLQGLRKRAKESEIDTTGLKKAELIEAIVEAELEADEDDEDDDEDEDLDDEDLADEYEDDEDEEEDEEEEPEPAPRKRPAAKKAAAKAPAKAPAKAAKAAPAKRTVKRR